MSYSGQIPCVLCPSRVAVRHVKVKPKCAVLTMLKRLDKIRFRGPRTRDDFPELAESPPASDSECTDEMQQKPRTVVRDTEDLHRDPVSTFFFQYSWFISFFLFFLFTLYVFLGTFRIVKRLKLLKSCRINNSFWKRCSEKHQKNREEDSVAAVWSLLFISFNFIRTHKVRLTWLVDMNRKIDGWWIFQIGKWERNSNKLQE